MRECSLRMIRLGTDEPHHRIYVSRKMFGRDSTAEEVIMTFDVGREVVEYPMRGRNFGVNEAADIQDARAFAHQLAAIEVVPWKNQR